MLERAPLTALSPFAHLAVPTAMDGKAGVTVAERTGLGLASVAARHGADVSFAEALERQVSITLRSGPKVSRSGDGTMLLGTGPGRWLAVSNGGGWRFASDLNRRLGDTASVCDQSSGFGVLSLAGPKLRDVLAKGVPIDLHPAAFATGDVAATLAGHIAIVLWQVDETPTFDLAVSRSYAGDFWHWLTSGAAEFGLAIAAPVSPGEAAKQPPSLL